jgi:hypothetical protein
LSHGICNYIRMYIYAVAKSVMLYWQHAFHNIIFKIKHILYIASGSAPRQRKIVGARLLQSIVKWSEVKWSEVKWSCPFADHEGMRGSEGMAVLLLNLSTRRRWVAKFTPRKASHISTGCEGGWAQSQSVRSGEKKNLLPLFWGGGGIS